MASPPRTSRPIRAGGERSRPSQQTRSRTPGSWAPPDWVHINRMRYKSVQNNPRPRGLVRGRRGAASIRARSDSAVDHNVWRNVGFALHDLTTSDSRWPGRALWDEWSKTCPENFAPAGQDKAWASFGRDYDGERVTVATIFHMAREAGWRDAASPFAAVSDEAPPVEPKAAVDFSRRLRTDAGNALAFLDLFGENLRFVEKWGCWIVWDGARWREASDIAMLPLARRATEEMLKWAVAQSAGNADRDAWIKHAVATQKESRLRAT